MSDIILRPAVPTDAAALLDIYAPYVTQTAITFECDVPSVDEFRGRIESTLRLYPYLVAVLRDGSLADNDLIVQARTGSGKTLAFALPLLNGMEPGARTPRIIVLSPTRELAQQTAREFAWLGADMGVRVATLVGGLDMERQIRSLRDGASVIVGTPGRILDHLRREEEKKVGADRLTLRGTGDRSDKIRTYNFPQNRLTDHRIGLTLHALDRILNGDLGEVLSALRNHDLEERLARALKERT